jgi:phospholipid-binding lipoprotein MlaA
MFNMKKISLLGLLFSAALVLPACSAMKDKTYSSNMHTDDDIAAIETAAGQMDVDAGQETGVSAGDVGLDSLTDPLEGVNRRVFAFNKAVDDAVIFPVLDGYRAVVPKPARTGLSNFLSNLKTPTRFANQLLQGDITGAFDELTRGVVNTFVGVGGLFDVAGYEGIKKEDEDFGQTLGVWGIGHGPYVVVPFFGGVSSRDLVGVGVDYLADPLNIYLDNEGEDGLVLARGAASYIDLRNELMDVLKQLEYGAVDYYATIRASYYQRRESLKNDGKTHPQHGDDVFAEFDAL